MRHSLLISALVAGTLLVPASAAGASTDIVISEFRARGPAGGNDEFVEIRNKSAAPVADRRLQLQGCAAARPATRGLRAAVPRTMMLRRPGLPVREPAQAGYSGSVTPDATYGTGSPTSPRATSPASASSPRRRRARRRRLSLGSPCREGTGLHDVPVANASDQSLRAHRRHEDTDDNIADFIGPKAGNPQNFEGTDPAGPTARRGGVHGSPGRRRGASTATARCASRSASP